MNDICVDHVLEDFKVADNSGTLCIQMTITFKQTTVDGESVYGIVGQVSGDPVRQSMLYVLPDIVETADNKLDTAMFNVVGTLLDTFKTRAKEYYKPTLLEDLKVEEHRMD